MRRGRLRAQMAALGIQPVRYLRLKMGLLLRVSGGTVLIGALLILLARSAGPSLYALGGSVFAWFSSGAFGQNPVEAARATMELYTHRNELFLLTLFPVMPIAFYLVMGHITHWPDRIALFVRCMVSAPEQAPNPHLPRALAPLEADLNAIRVQLYQREASEHAERARQRDLVAFLAHDLKTPLTSIVGYLTLLQDSNGLTDAQRAQYTGIALDKARRLEGLLLEFFDITCMDLDIDPLRLTDVQLSLLLEQIADEFYPLFEEKQLDVQIDIAPRLNVWGDPDMLARVFDNVLRNAVNYSAPGGPVTLTARRVPSGAEVAIANEGLSIPEEELSKIFQKFYRLDAARSSLTGGAGLGLAIAKEIVDRHGGSIRAECNGRFTRFLITLPDARHRH